MNVAFMGSVSSSHCALDALIRGGVELTGVLGVDESESQRISDFQALRPLAESAGVPFQPFVRVTEPAVERFLEARAPDLLWVIGLSQLLPQRIIGIARHGGVGFHPTMLPRGRGRAPVAWTILLGERAAVNLFFLTDEPDAGDIIIQREVPVLPDDYSEDLIRRTNGVLADAILELAPAIKSGALPRVPQDHSRATYYKKRTPDDGLIDWSRPTDAIYRLIRAAGRPYPGAFTFSEGRKVTIWRGEPVDVAPEDTDCHNVDWRNMDPGVVCDQTDESRIVVKTGDGAFRITEMTCEDGGTGIGPRAAAVGTRFTPSAKGA
ncbi:MAG: methionyl-tRNA formyltransferase [Planctomycetes bacterium]|nr:methionyl-tRNA formyltransferase [Planctomycetota bacterium]